MSAKKKFFVAVEVTEVFLLLPGSSPTWQELYIILESDTVDYTVKSLVKEYIFEKEYIITCLRIHSFHKKKATLSVGQSNYAIGPFLIFVSLAE